MLLLDEIDHFQKNGNSQSETEEVNTLLQEIERGRNKILFIGTTNEIEQLPDSLIRDGRMGAVIHFEHCDSDAARAVLQNVLKAKSEIPQVKNILENEELMDNIAKRCNGMVAPSVSAILNDALMDSVIKDITLEAAIDNAVRLRRKKILKKCFLKILKMQVIGLTFPKILQ